MPHNAVVHQDGFEGVIIANSHNDAGRKAKDMIKYLNAIRVQEYTMNGQGSGSRGDRAGLAMSLGNTQTLYMIGARPEYSDDQTRDLDNLKGELAQAFGAEIAQMGDFVAEIISALEPESPLTAEQKEQMLGMVADIIALKNLMNLGVTAEGQAKIEALIAETATKIAETLLDGMDHNIMPAAIIDFVQGMLRDVQQHYDIPALDDAMAKIEGRMDPENYLANAAAAMIEALTEILEGEEALSDEARAEIESLIEQMQEALDQGLPIPRAVMQALDTLSINHPDIPLSQDFSASLDTLKDANIAQIVRDLGHYGVSLSYAAAEDVGAPTSQASVTGQSNDATASTLETAPQATSSNAAVFPALALGGLGSAASGVSANAGSSFVSPSSPRAEPSFTAAAPPAANNNDPKPTPPRPGEPSTNPEAKDPEAKKPDAKQPDVKEPEGKDPEVKDTEAKDPEPSKKGPCPFCDKIDEVNKKIEAGESVSDKELSDLVGQDVVEKFTRQEVIEYLNDYKKALQILQDNNIQPEDYSSGGAKITHINKTLKDILEGKGHICDEFCEHSNPKLAAALKTLQTINTDFYKKTKEQQIKAVQEETFALD